MNLHCAGQPLAQTSWAQCQAARRAQALRAAKLQLLLEEPLTRPLGSMLALRGFTPEDAVTLVHWPRHSGHNPLESRRHLTQQLPAPANTRELVGLPLTAAAVAATRELEDEVCTRTALGRARDQAHARLEHFEAAASRSLSARARQAHTVTAACGPAQAARQGSQTGAPRARALKPSPIPSETAPSQPPSFRDARNALRHAYAAHKLIGANAPPRSSAQTASIVGGWKCVRNTHRNRRPALRNLWPWAAGLGTCSMLLAYTLTLSLVPQTSLTLDPVPAQASSVRSPETTQPSPSARLAHEHPSKQLEAHASASIRPAKVPVRASPLGECREPKQRTKPLAAQATVQR